MSTLTGGDLNLVKPELTDDHKVTIGTDLPANFQKIDDEFTAHLADTTPHSGATPEFNGIVFPATQVPSAGANTLDDYEEGTWTGALACGTSGTITLMTTVKTGSYTKIGRIVVATGAFRVDSVSSPVGTLTLSGLPFAVASVNSGYGSASIMITGLASGATTSIVTRINAGESAIQISKYINGSIADLAGDVAANTYIAITAVYTV
jgi:hypothetical protein